MNYLPFQRNINASVSLLIIDNKDNSKTAYWINPLDNSQQIKLTYISNESNRCLCNKINKLFRFESHSQVAFDLLQKSDNLKGDIDNIAFAWTQLLDRDVETEYENRGYYEHLEYLAECIS